MKILVGLLGACAVPGCVVQEATTLSRSDAIWSGEFEAGAVGSPIRIEEFSARLDVWGTHVAGCLDTTFAADSGSDMSASHRFALPRGAVIHRAEIFVASTGQWERAETLGRREGEEVFEEIIEPETRDPLLIQQIGMSGYRARVYPVGRDQTLQARICYTHTLELDDLGERLRLSFADPTDPDARTVEEFDVQVALHDPRWTDAIWYSEVGDSETEAGHASFHATDYALGDPVVLELVGSTPRRLLALAYDSAADGIEDHLLVRWLPDFSAFPAAQSGARSVVFVVDTSGSMDGAKMEETRSAVSEALESLVSTDRYGLVEFDDEARAFRDDLSIGDDVADALAWVSSLQADGGTNIAGGLTSGAQIGARSAEASTIDLFLLTDGRPTVGAGTIGQILSEVRAAMGERPFRIFCVGIGYDLDQALLADLASETGGEATFALDDSEIGGQVLELLSRVRGGGAADVAVTLSGGGIAEDQLFEWRRVFPGTPLAMAATGANVDARFDVSLRGVTPDGDPVAIDSSAIPTRGSDGRFFSVPPLAAQTWADRLNRTIDQTGETADLVGEGVVLAKQYGIVGRYSSMLALENESMYAEYGIDRIAREAAGIALDDVTASAQDETRIGGQGVDDTSSGGGDADGDADGDGAGDGGASEAGAAGCGCGTAGTSPTGALWLAALAAFWRRRQRRRRA